MSLKITNYCDYKASYDSNLLRGVDNPATPRPWNLKNIIMKHCSMNATLLDISCGIAFKLFPLASAFKEIIGIDPSKSIIKTAKEGILKCVLTQIL